jgi:hypothetical protein
MSQERPLHVAEALANAITRYENAEAQVLELKEALRTQAICLENAYGTCNRLQMQLAEERERHRKRVEE